MRLPKGLALMDMIELVRDCFDEVDKNKDGAITAKEFMPFIMKRIEKLPKGHAWKVPPYAIHNVFEILETEGDKKVTLAELEHRMNEISTVNIALAHLKAEFDLWDMNADGKLDREEWVRFLDKSTIDWSDEEIQFLLAQDHPITFEEFAHRLESKEQREKAEKEEREKAQKQQTQQRCS